MNEAKQTAVQAGKFGLVGLFNTAFDFVLAGTLFRLTRQEIFANTTSTAIAMTISFFLNKNLVFGARGTRGIAKQAVLFFGVTAFGLWVLQNGVIVLLTKYTGFFPPLVLSIARPLGVVQIIKDEPTVVFVAAKAVGTFVSLVWNFVLYKKFVFTRESSS